MSHSAATATATTVSTFASDHTMGGSKGKGRSKKMTSLNKSRSASTMYVKSGTSNAPVVWYAFYSEASGREYYYEPTSRTATWIMPDDYHPYPSQGDGEDDAEDLRNNMMPPKLKRKVSFRASSRDDDGERYEGASTSRTITSRSPTTRSDDKQSLENNDNALAASLEISKLKAERKFFKRVVIAFVCIAIVLIVVVVFQHGDGLIHVPMRLSMRATKEVNATWQQNIAVVKKEESANMGIQVLIEETTNAKVQGGQLHVKESLQDISREYDQSDDNNSLDVVDVDADHDSAAAVQGLSSKNTDKIATTTSSVAREIVKIDLVDITSCTDNNYDDKTEGPAPAHCKVPFAYIVSGVCRRRKSPIFDAERFTLFMIQ